MAIMRVHRRKAHMRLRGQRRTCRSLHNVCSEWSTAAVGTTRWRRRAQPSDVAAVGVGGGTEQLLRVGAQPRTPLRGLIRK